MTSQRELIKSYIESKLQVQQDRLRPSSPSQLTFRTPNGKPFARLVTTAEASKNSIKDSLALRCDPLLAGSLCLEKGFSRLSGDEWISAALDGTIRNDMLYSLLEMAYVFTDDGVRSVPQSTERSWIVPANPKYFDLFEAFRKSDTILWKQSSNIAVGDVVYLYVALPYSAILFRCRAVEVDIPYTKKNSRRNIKRAMRIQRLFTYPKDAFHLDRLKEYGITTVRGPRSVPPALKAALEKTYNCELHT